LLVHRKERGAEIEVRRFDALMLRLDDLEMEIARLERQISEAKQNGAAETTAAATPAASTEGPAPA
jgi:hypothetical protein